MDEGPADADALPLPGGKPAGGAIGALPEVEDVDEPLDPGFERVSAEAVEGAEGMEDLAGREPIGDAGGGRDVAEPTAGPDRVDGDITAADAGRAGGRRQERGEHPQGGRLAGPVGTEEPDHLAGIDRERDPVDGPDDPPRRGAVMFDQIHDFDHVSSPRWGGTGAIRGSPQRW